MINKMKTRMDRLKKTYMGLGILAVAYFANAFFNASVVSREYGILIKIPEYNVTCKKIMRLESEKWSYNQFIRGIDAYFREKATLELKVPQKIKSIEDMLTMERENALIEMIKIKEQVQSLRDKQDPEIKRHEEKADTYTIRVFNLFYSKKQKK